MPQKKTIGLKLVISYANMNEWPKWHIKKINEQIVTWNRVKRPEEWFCLICYTGAASDKIQFNSIYSSDYNLLTR